MNRSLNRQVRSFPLLWKHNLNLTIWSALPNCFRENFYELTVHRSELQRKIRNREKNLSKVRCCSCISSAIVITSFQVILCISVDVFCAYQVAICQIWVCHIPTLLAPLLLTPALDLRTGMFKFYFHVNPVLYSWWFRVTFASTPAPVSDLLSTPKSSRGQVESLFMDCSAFYKLLLICRYLEEHPVPNLECLASHLVRQWSTTMRLTNSTIRLRLLAMLAAGSATLRRLVLYRLRRVTGSSIMLKTSLRYALL